MQTETPLFSFAGPWGLSVQVMPSLGFLLLLFVGFSATSVEAATWGLNMFAIVVASILLHELGHACGARVQGVPVHRVVLYGGGGFCQHRAAGARASEFIVLMGPIVNLALWAALSLFAFWLVPAWSGGEPTEAAIAAHFDTYAARFELIYWLETAADLNLMLFVLNMVPVQPLDGGKLAHLWLLRVVSEPRAMAVAGGVGLVCTVLWVPAMIAMYFYVGFILLFIPSLRGHWAMLRAGARLGRMWRR
ncbi:MAG: site-2 protease family protein [Pseudomonadota bacterium]